MRDFRNAKAMARTLRATLAAKGLKIAASESLELVAQMFGLHDWNMLSAAINDSAQVERRKASPPCAFERISNFPFSTRLAASMRRVQALTNQRKHKYATLEHLLFGLLDDDEALISITGKSVDPVALKSTLADYLDNSLNGLVVDNSKECRPTPAFKRVIGRAEHRAEDANRLIITSSDVLAVIFAERLAPAAKLLIEHGLRREDVQNF